MATFTLQLHDRFPEGTSVDVYPASNWPPFLFPPTGPPAGTKKTSAISGKAGSAFKSLDDATEYVAYARVDGEHRYVRFWTK